MHQKTTLSHTDDQGVIKHRAWAMGKRRVGSGNLLRAAWNEVGVMGQDSVNWSSSAILTVKQIRCQRVTTRLARFQIHHQNAAK